MIIASCGRIERLSNPQPPVTNRSATAVAFAPPVSCSRSTELFNLISRSAQLVEVSSPVRTVEDLATKSSGFHGTPRGPTICFLTETRPTEHTKARRGGIAVGTGLLVRSRPSFMSDRGS
jgi:hypothetical protein